MAFRDFTFPAVVPALGLTLAEADLYGGVPALDLPAGFADRMRDDVTLAVAVDTEKARSEFIIAPILAELRRMLGGRFGLFSGVAFDVDPGRGLTGYCDFILTRSPLQLVLTAPVVAIAEAKVDNTRTGLGQCIAGMVAAREFNAKAGGPAGAVYGASTTGTAWRFLRLTGDALVLDRQEYSVTELGRVMGILAHILAA